MEPFLGEIGLFAFNKIPDGWHICDGTLMDISSNQALYSLLGVQFGGSQASGKFALPDLRGRTPVGNNYGDRNYLTGKMGGTETVTLTAATTPAHTHGFAVSSLPGDFNGSAGANYAASPSGANMYAAKSNPVVGTDTAMLAAVGGGQAHTNMQPYLALTYCIATSGMYPMRP